MKSRAIKVVIVAVAMILPGIAVADVMISGTLGINGTQNSPAFYFTKGPNFNAVAYAGYLFFAPQTTGKMAEIDFQGIANQSIFALNALEVAFSSGVSGTFYLNFTGGQYAFPPGSTIYLSTSQLGYSDFGSVGSPTVTPTITTSPTLQEVNFHLALGSTVSTSWTVTGSTIIYISYYLPAGYGTMFPHAEVFISGALVIS